MEFLELWDSEVTRRLSSSDTSRLFTPTRRQAAVNRGAMTFARLTNCCVADVPLDVTDLVDGQAWVAVSTPASAFYGFSPQGLLLRRTHVVSGQIRDYPLVRRSSEFMDRYRSGWRTWCADPTKLGGGMPEEYVWWPGNFYGLSDEATDTWGRDGIVSVFPAPMPSKFANETWRLVAVQWEVPVTMTTDTDLPFTTSSSPSPRELDSYHPAIADFATYQLEKLRRDIAAQDSNLKMFNDHVQRFLQTRRQRGGDELIDTLGSIAAENTPQSLGAFA